MDVACDFIEDCEALLLVGCEGLQTADSSWDLYEIGMVLTNTIGRKSKVQTLSNVIELNQFQPRYT